MSYCDECMKPCGECSGELRDLRRVLAGAKKLLEDPTSGARLESLRAWVEMAEETSSTPKRSAT